MNQKQIHGGDMSGESKSRLLVGYQPGEPSALDSPPSLVSVIAPARDEAASLSCLIPRIKESLLGYPYEIIVIDYALYRQLSAPHE